MKNTTRSTLTEKQKYMWRLCCKYFNDIKALPIKRKSDDDEQNRLPGEKCSNNKKHYQKQWREKNQYKIKEYYTKKNPKCYLDVN